MRLDAEILDRRPEEGARVVALALCADAEAAARRLGTPGDAEALHDFRVALRRLRSALRAFRPALGGLVRDRDRKRLRRLARRTGPARDAEVLAAWLREAPGLLAHAYRPACEWLLGRVERVSRDQGARAGGEAALEFGDLRLAQALAAGGAAPDAPAETFGQWLAALLRAQARALKEALAAVAGPGDAASAHRARIAAKRLRYLVEPLRDNARADGGPAVKGLKELQDVLGRLNDAHRATAEVAAALVVAAAERARGDGGNGPALRPGLLAVERLARERAAALHEELDRSWLAGGTASLLDPVYAVVAALEWRDAEEAAPERRLLLESLPEAARGEPEELEQGWIGGDGPRESVGAVRSAAGERFFRSTVQGKGDLRLETSEEMERAEFEAYWPLTEGRRVRKRLHRPRGLPGWRFEEYLDRRLVVGVASEGAAAPDWLEPLVVRDVTGERGYSDEALAKRPARKGS